MLTRCPLPRSFLSWKHSKEQITIIVGVNLTATKKLHFLVIAKTKNPKCLKGVKSLEVDYNFYKKAWMTSDIFEKWLVKLDKSITNNIAK